MEMLSEKYGWTPNEIRSIALEDIHNYLEIISIKNRIERSKNKK